jgi:hypothetical protein
VTCPAHAELAVAAAAQRAGPAIDVVGHDDTLLLALPLQDDSRDYRVRDHARLLSRLN